MSGITLRDRWSSLKTRLWIGTKQLSAPLVFTNGGIGDELLLTAVAHQARQAGCPVHVLARYPDIWKGNDDPLSVEHGMDRWHYAFRRRWIQGQCLHLSANNHSDHHLAQQMAAHLGLTLPEGWRPVFAGKPAVERKKKRIVVQNSCRGALYAASTKEWPQKYWIELMAALSSRFETVQLGTLQDPPLDGATDLRGRTSLRQAAEQLASASLFIGLESGLMHLAAAMRTPSVIIYGGRTSPVVTGYPSNINIVRKPPCSPCGLNDGCPNQLICLEIDPGEVRLAAESILENQNV